MSVSPGPVYEAPSLVAENIEACLEAHRRESLLRFVTCESVDDGKSALIGRPLYDSRMLFDDQLATLSAVVARCAH